MGYIFRLSKVIAISYIKVIDKLLKLSVTNARNFYNLKANQ